MSKFVIRRVRIGRLQSLRRIINKINGNKEHVQFCLVSVMVSWLNVKLSRYLLTNDQIQQSDDITYGPIIDALTYTSLIINYVQLPFLFVPPLITLFYYNCFTCRVPSTLASSSQGLPTICFRIVTVGDYPQLVIRNLELNLQTCKEVGLKHYIIEIVTEKRIGAIADSNVVKQIVVPHDYRTKNNSKFKARCLQYCLEDNINCLKDEDWILHLNEDSILTADGLRGIANFVASNKHKIGQGSVRFHNRHQSIWTRLIDTRIIQFYIAFNMGCRLARNPCGSVKGSNLLCNVAAEKDITFDFGEGPSLFEDCAFGLNAQNKGYSLGYVEGEVIEQGVANLQDLVNQQRRFITGYFNIIKSELFSLKKSSNFLVFAFNFVFFQPIGMLSLILRVVYPIRDSTLTQYGDGIFLFGITVYQVFMAFKDTRVGKIHFIIRIMLRVAFGPFLQLIISQYVFVLWLLTKPPVKFTVNTKIV